MVVDILDPALISLHEILDPSGGESVGVFFRLLGPCLPYSIIIICYLLIIRRLKVIIVFIIIDIIILALPYSVIIICHAVIIHHLNILYRILGAICPGPDF